MIKSYWNIIDIVARNSKNALMLAVEDRNIAMSMMLISYGSNINLEDRLGRNVLFKVLRESHDIKLAKYLIEKGMDINKRDIRGFTPLMMLEKRKSKDFAHLLLRNNVDLNVRTNRGDTALSLSCKNKDYFMFTLLIYHGADINIEYEDKMTCLHIALHNNLIRFVDGLLNQGLTFGVEKHSNFKLINDETHEYFIDYEGYREYILINQE